MRLRVELEYARGAQMSIDMRRTPLEMALKNGWIACVRCLVLMSESVPSLMNAAYGLPPPDCTTQSASLVRDWS